MIIFSFLILSLFLLFSSFLGCGNRQKSLITKQMLEELAALPVDDADDGGILPPVGVK